MDTMVLLIDGVVGVYVPRNFYENFDFGEWQLNVSEYSDLSDPDKEHYWDAWDEVLNRAEHHDSNGHIWTLYMHEGDLFAVRDDHKWNED